MTNSQKSRKEGATLERRLAAYGSMSLALAAVSAGPAQAGPVSFYTDLTTAPGSPIFFNAMTGSAGSISSPDDFELLTSEFASISKAVFEFAPGNVPNGNAFAASRVGGNSFSSVARLAQGALVGPALTFSSIGEHLASNSYPGLGHFNPVPETGDIGLRMVRGSDTFYGWADITVNADYSITLNAFGYDDAGNPVTTDPPQTPEPASIVLLALGAAGIAAWRRRMAR